MGISRSGMRRPQRAVRVSRHVQSVLVVHFMNWVRRRW